MSKLQYCINCGEAVETEDVIVDITEFSSGGLFTPGGIKWRHTTYAVCINEECPRYALLSSRVTEKPKKK